MRKYFLILCTCFAFLGSLGLMAAERPLLDCKAVLERAAAVVPAQWPDANTVLVDDFQKIVYQPDGTDRTVDDYYVKILTEKGRQDHARMQFHYNRFYETFELALAEIVHPDGSKVPVTSERLKTVTSGDGMQSNIYDPDDLQLELVLPELAVNDVIHLVTVTTAIRTRTPGMWFTLIPLQDRDPVLGYTVEIEAPAERPLLCTLVKDEVSGKVRFEEKREENRIRYLWRASDVPQIVPEPSMPAAYLHSMRILVSTVPDWETISRWYWELCEPHLKATGGELPQFTRTLLEGAKDDEEKIRRIFQFVATQIRYMGVTAESQSPGYEPHDVELTFSRRHGVCRDKAALLTAMLRSAGFDADMVLIMAGNPKDAEIPNSYFNHAVTVIRQADGSDRLLDSTGDSPNELFPSYLAEKSYLAATEKGATLKLTPAVDFHTQLTRITATGAVDAKNCLTLQVKAEFSGLNDTAYRGAFSEWQPEERQQFLSRMCAAVLPGSRLQSYRILPEDIRDLTKPLQLILQVECPDFLLGHAGTAMIAPPFFGKSLGLAAFYARKAGLAARKYPLQLNAAIGTEEQFTIQLPPEYRPEKLPEPLQLQDAPLIGTLAFRYDGARNELHGSRTVAYPAATVPAAAYPELKKRLAALAAADRRKAILTKEYEPAALPTLFPDAQSVVEQWDSVYDLISPDRWSVTTHLRRRILNFGGSRNYAELPLPYLEGVEETVLENATVIRANGEKLTLRQEELPLLDDPAVRPDPRYPAAKLRVAALPGVEPGSVIDCTVRRTVGKRPFYGAFAAFYDQGPILNRSVTVRYPANAKAFQHLQLTVTGPGITERRTEQDGIVTAVFTEENVAPAETEEHEPPEWTFRRGVLIDRTDLTGFAERLYNRIMECAQDNPETAAFARKLTEKAESSEAKIRLIRDFVSREIQSAGTGVDRMPLENLSKADVTLHARTGNSADRAILLLAMLNAVEIKASPVAAASFPLSVKGEGKLGFPEEFQSVLVRITDEENEIYLNDTTEYAELGTVQHNGKAGLDLASGELVEIHPTAEKEDSFSVGSEWTLDAEGNAAIRTTENSYGMDFAVQKRFFALQTPSDLAQYLEKRAANVAQGAVSTGSERNFAQAPGTFVQQLSLPQFAVIDGDWCSFTLPASPEFKGLFPRIGERKNPFMIASPVDTTVQYRVTLPRPVATVRIAPESRQLLLPGAAGSFQIQVQAAVGSREIVLEFHLVMHPAVIPAAEYSALNRVQDAADSPASRTFLLQLIPAK